MNVSVGEISRYVDIDNEAGRALCGDPKAPLEQDVTSIDQESAVIALIEPRLLLGQCLLLALRAVDQTSAFRVHSSVAEWGASPDRASTSLVLICVSDVVEDRNAAVDLELQMCKPSVKFAILADQESPKSVLKVMQSGAQGYIPTSLSLEVTSQILQLMRFGGTFVPASSLMIMATGSATAQQESNNQLFTSQRQLMVARALRKGAPNKVIAYQLNMCESTVKVHVRNIMKKLKAKNRTEVALITTQMFPDDGNI